MALSKVSLLLLLVVASFCLASQQNDISDDIVDGLNKIFQVNLLESETSQDTGRSRQLIEQILSLKKDLIGEETTYADDDETPWFRFLPFYSSSIIPSDNMNDTGPVSSWSTPCYDDVQAQVTTNGSEYFLEITSEKPTRPLVCEDFYLIATMENLAFKTVRRKGSDNLIWKADRARPSELFDIQNNGFRVFLFSKGPLDIIKYVASTIELFNAEFSGPGVKQQAAAMNAAFLNNYTDFSYQPRGSVQNVDIDPSQINSGDFFGITRMDGLDPMICWGMGGTTGHTTTALWIGDELNVCESTVNDDYWPTNGVQCTEWNTWIEQARNASFNLVHVPLSPTYRDMYNATAAYEYFLTVQGMPYGYHNFLFGWLDTENDNLPCLPPDYKQCLTSELVMVVSGLFDRLDKWLADRMFNEAFNKRLNSDMKSTAEIYEYAITQEGISFGELITMPEQDSWDYDGQKSMVCDVFVCSMWKAAGLFGDLTDQFQCTELTPRDVYSIAFFDANYTRPQQCVDADPNSPFCQLSGEYTMSLPGWNTKQPYANMGQTCPGLPPQYQQPSNC